MDQTDQHRHFDERADHRGESHPGRDSEHGDGHRDGQFEIVPRRGESQRGAARVIRPGPPPEEEAEPEHQDEVNDQRHRDAQHVERQPHDGVALESEHDDNGEQQRDQSDRRNHRHEFPVIPLAPPERNEDDPTQHTRGKRDPEVDHHAGEDLPDGHIGQRFAAETLHAGQIDAQQARQPRDENPRVKTEREDLENAVEGHESGAVFAVPLGQLVPDQHHGDAAGDTHQDETDHIFRLVAEKEHGEHEHQHGADDPVLQQREPDDFRIGENLRHLLVAHLGQRRIHHEDESRGNEQVGRADRDRREKHHRIRNQKISRQHPRRHRCENPQREVTVQKRHFARDSLGHSEHYPHPAGGFEK